MGDLLVAYWVSIAKLVFATLRIEESSFYLRPKFADKSVGSVLTASLWALFGIASKPGALLLPIPWLTLVYIFYPPLYEVAARLVVVFALLSSS